jgi:serine/threonine protein kinase
MNDQEDDPDPDETVLGAVSRLTGEKPSVFLRDSDAEQAAPVNVALKSNGPQCFPKGRGNYQLLGEIARGGMGIVLKGRDTDLGREVAVKVLNEKLLKNVSVVQRFVEEAQIGGQLQHPGIVPVYELGMMDDERPYFAMKLIKGRTLAELLTKRKEVTEDRRRLSQINEYRPSNTPAPSTPVPASFAP